MRLDICYDNHYESRDLFMAEEALKVLNVLNLSKLFNII